MQHTNQQSAGGYYSSKELAELLHADESTIKRWANRSKLKCFKTPGGHRRFTAEHVLEFIRNYRYELNPTRVTFHPAQQESHEPDPIPLDELFLNFALRGDVPNLIETLQHGVAPSKQLIDLYETVVIKTVQKLHHNCSVGTLSMVEMKNACSAIMESLLQFRLLSPRNLPNGKVAISASLSSAEDEIVLFCACHLLEMKGWKVYYLGAECPAELLAEMMERTRPDLVCLPAGYLTQNGHTISVAELLTRSSARSVVFNFFDDAKGGEQPSASPARVANSLKEFCRGLTPSARKSIAMSSH